MKKSNKILLGLSLAAAFTLASSPSYATSPDETEQGDTVVVQTYPSPSPTPEETETPAPETTPSPTPEPEPEGPIEVWETPPTPGQDDQCKVIDPNPNDLWYYETHYDEIGNTGYFEAWLPEGYQVQDSGERWWAYIVGGHVFEFNCVPKAVVTPPTTTPPTTTPPTTTPVDPTTDADGDGYPDQLAETGMTNQTWYALGIGAMFLGLGVFLLVRKIRQERALRNE